MTDKKRVRDIPDKERLRIVRDVSQLQTEIMLRFNNFMCEDEKFGFIERAIAETTNDGR